VKHATLCFLSYNRPAYLERAIRSAVAGAGEAVEVIVHDDGSTGEAVVGLIRDLQLEGLVSTFIANREGHNEGQGVALNRMFRMATGDLIFKLDQDLAFNAEWLPRARAILRGNRRDFGEPEIGLLGLLHYHADPVDTAKCRVHAWPRWEQHTHILGSGFAVPRECWEDLGPFEERSAAFAEDHVFQLRVTESERWVCALPPLNENLAENDAMGPGPSTIVGLDSSGQVVVTPIQAGPYLVTPDLERLPA